MPKHTQFKVGGVPEHFNLPWKKAIEENRFASHAIDIDWKDYGGGTGAMTKALREGELDIAILLTEGIIADNIVEIGVKLCNFMSSLLFDGAFMSMPIPLLRH